MEFKKKVISMSDEGLKQAEKVAEAKITLLQSAIDEAKKHVTIDDLKAFSENFISYTTTR